MKKAIITGITGQDGAYLTASLLNKGYEVYGTYRRSSSVNYWRLAELGISENPNLHLVEFDLTDASSAIRLVEQVQPDEIYNLAAQSFVGVSFEQPLATAAITGVGVVHLLEAIRVVDRQIKFYQASTSEMFGHVQAIPQVESTPFIQEAPTRSKTICALDDNKLQSLTIYLAPAVFCLTMNHRFGASNL